MEKFTFKRLKSKILDAKKHKEYWLNALLVLIKNVITYLSKQSLFPLQQSH